MADEPKPRPEPADEPPAEQGSKEPKTTRFLTRLLTPKWLLILLAVSVLGHALGFALFRLGAGRGDGRLGPEVSLGEFRFAADPAEAGPIAGAEFSLHIALLDQVEQAARRELNAKKLRVQQAVEELIRRAHGGDFDDPQLAGLKQQLQEQINEALGIRVIADVIITDLKLERKGGETGMISETTEFGPGMEDPRGPEQPNVGRQALRHTRWRQAEGIGEPPTASQQERRADNG